MINPKILGLALVMLCVFSHAQTDYQLYSFTNTNAEWSTAKDLIFLDNGDLLMFMMSLDPSERGAFIRIGANGEEIYRTEFPLYMKSYDRENSILLRGNQASIFHSWEFSNAYHQNRIFRTSIDIDSGEIVGDTVNVVFDYETFSDYDRDLEFYKTWDDQHHFYALIPGFGTPESMCQGLLKFNENELSSYSCYDGVTFFGSSTILNRREIKAANKELNQLFSIEYIVNDSAEYTGTYNAQIHDFEGNSILSSPLQEGYLNLVEDCFYFEDGIITTRPSYGAGEDYNNKVGVAILDDELNPVIKEEFFDQGMFHKAKFRYLYKSQRILLFHTEENIVSNDTEEFDYVSVFDLSLNILGTKPLGDISHVRIQDVLEGENGNFYVYGAQTMPTTPLNEALGWQYAAAAFVYKLNTFDIEVGSGVNESPFSNRLSVAPNPNVGRFKIIKPQYLGLDYPKSLKLFNQKGTCVFERTISDLNDEINLHFLPSGLYFLTIDNTYSVKIVLE